MTEKSKPMKTRVAIYGPNLYASIAGEAIHAHRPGCADTEKDVYANARPPWFADVASLKELVHEIYDPECFEYDPDAEWLEFAGDIRVFPCLDLPDENTEN